MHGEVFFVSGVSSLTVLLYAVILTAVIFLIKLFEKPIRFLIRLVFNSALGGMLIIVINTLCAGFSFQIAINAVTLTLCAFLGVGGVGLLALFNLII